MKYPLKQLGLLAAVFFCVNGFGQKGDFQYRREIKGINDQWHRIILPDDIFGKVNTDLSDIRILGITPQKDTLEVPYILNDPLKQVSLTEIPFVVMNESANEKGYYFTFDAKDSRRVNEIVLAFKRTNFDWKVNLEGSQNLEEWFSIAEDYRILSIHNSLTEFNFTKLVFPVSEFRYFRVLIKSTEKPLLKSASIRLKQTREGLLKTYPIVSQTFEEDSKFKQTLVFLTLKEKVPVSSVKIWVNNQVDYYRPVSVLYLDDSVKTKEEWRYYYQNLASAIVQSSTANTIEFTSSLVQKLKLVIQNGDNRALKIDSLQVGGYQYELTARFTEPAEYYLVYGNKLASKPDYDIARFKEHIPGTITTLSLGKVEVNPSQKGLKASPIFENKLWLWLVMGIIVLVLGWFTLSMMKKKAESSS